MLMIRLFGIGKASYLGEELAGFPGQQPSLLLCYLLLNRHYPQHREHLASVFWGNHPDLQARKALRNALWRLRQSFTLAGASFDEYILAVDESVAFITSSLHWIDVEVFERTATSYQNINSRELSAEQAAQLESAVHLYTGDLLSSVYEDWVLVDRERLGMMYVNILNKLMVYHGLQGDYERGIAYGERILERDRTREKIHRQIMWLHCLSGDRNAALGHYKRCQEILRTELGIDPMAETRQLYEQILNNNFSLSSAGEGLQQYPAVRAAPAPLAASPTQKSLDYLIQRLQELQARVDETNAELHVLEKLIYDATLSKQARAALVE